MSRSPTIKVIHGDMLTVLPAMEADSIAACVTDPPYHLSTVKRFGGDNAPVSQPEFFNVDGTSKGASPYVRASSGFMGKQWDGGDIAFRSETWAAVLRVLKPGGYLLAFGGTRTYHRLVCAIEDAGFEIRDTIAWLYGSGFPKSLDISKAIDRAAGADAARQWSGWGTALKPAMELICIARKPLSERTVVANVLRHSTGGLNIDACRIAGGDTTTRHNSSSSYMTGRIGEVQPLQDEYETGSILGRWAANVAHDGSADVLRGFPETGASSDRPRNNGAFDSVAKGHDYPHVSGGHADSGSAARFFYSSKAGKNDRVSRTIEQVDIEWTSETGPCRAVLQVDTEQSVERATVSSGSATSDEWNTFLYGNTITDLCRTAYKSTISTVTNSTTELRTWKPLARSLINACMAGANCEMENGSSHAVSAAQYGASVTITLGKTVSLPGVSHAPSGTLLKISVSAKQHGHPTVKPVDLMRWLVRLVTPPGGTVLDCFAGSGTTGEAAMLEGFNAILIEREVEHAADIAHRVKRWEGGDLPLFIPPPRVIDPEDERTADLFAEPRDE